MFKNPFSFDGRIKRVEYAITFVAYMVLYVLLRVITDGEDGIKWLMIFYIPLFWIAIAQSAKRCHDLNKSGWWQLIPFYGFVLLFAAGDPYANDYGGDFEVFYGADDYEKPFVVEEENGPAVVGGVKDGNMP